MQSGITASKELQDAFNGLVSNPTQRGLLVGITAEQLVPLSTLSSTNPSADDFHSDLAVLAPHLQENAAAYVILRRVPHAADGYVAITYVPDTAPVRQKMLFASTRLTLVRELGTERFRETLFVTRKDELTAEGWRRHEAHQRQAAPLTDEEQALRGVKEAEAEEGSKGTGGRRELHETKGLRSPVSAGAMAALKGLGDGMGGANLVQLKIDVKTESVDLASSNSVDIESLASAISASEPRYSFFRYEHEFEGQLQEPIIFISSCPSGLKVKERMMYAASRSVFLNTAKVEAGLDISKKIEVSDPSEITAATVHEEFHPKVEQRQAFSRPKRPGRK